MKSNKCRIVRCIAVGLAVCVMTLGAGSPRLEAMMVPNSAVDAQAVAADRLQDMASIQKTLESKLLQQRLADFGLSSEEIDNRLSRLSDQQLHQVALQIEKQNPAGNETVDAIWAVAAVLLVILLVLKLIDKI